MGALVEESSFPANLPCYSGQVTPHLELLSKSGRTWGSQPMVGNKLNQHRLGEVGLVCRSLGPFSPPPHPETSVSGEALESVFLTNSPGEGA